MKEFLDLRVAFPDLTFASAVMTLSVGPFCLDHFEVQRRVPKVFRIPPPLIGFERCSQRFVLANSTGIHGGQLFQ